MTAHRRLVIIGAGGFAREVRWLAEEINAVREQFRVVGFVVSDLARLGEHDSKSEVLGDLGWLEAHCPEFDALAVGIGNPSVRLRVFGDLLARFPDKDWPPLIHPTVRFDRGTCTIGRGALLCAGVIGTVNLRIEDQALVNLACTLGHEARIGAGSVLNPTVNVSGGVDVGTGVLVGTGAQLLQYVRIGDGATVGAGAVVRSDVAPGQTVVGIPAKPLEKKA